MVSVILKNRKIKVNNPRWLKIVYWKDASCHAGKKYLHVEKKHCASIQVITKVLLVLPEK